VTETYLAGEDYKKIIKDKIAIGGITHKDRKLSESYKGIVGPDDQVLINDNATHYFTKIYMNDESDPFVYGEIEFFDPDLFTGERREKIINLMGMLKSGVKLPCSIVIHALWDRNEVATKIIRIKGVDFTQNNSFPNAGPVEITDSSVHAESIKEFSLTEEDQKEFTGCRSVVRAFSAEMSIVEESGSGSESGKDNATTYESVKEEIKSKLLNQVKEELAAELDKSTKKVPEDDKDNLEPKDIKPSSESKDEVTLPKDNEGSEPTKKQDESKASGSDRLNKIAQKEESEKTYTRDEIIHKYGRDSLEALVTKGFSTITEPELLTKLEQMKKNDPKLVTIKLRDDKEFDVPIDTLEHMYERIRELVKEGDPEVIRALKHPWFGTLESSVAHGIGEGWTVQTKPLVLRELRNFYRSYPDIVCFSTTDSVKNRMFYANYPKITLINRIFRTYKQYFDANNETFDDRDLKCFRTLVIGDLNLLLRNIHKQIEDGKKIVTIYGLQQFNDDLIIATSNKLTYDYKIALLSERTLNFIPEVKYKNWKQSLADFYSACLSYIESRPVEIELSLTDKL
jgi:hypothetical protein